MPNYRRVFVPGGTFFFTLVAENRAPYFAAELARNRLHDAIAACQQRRSFELDAFVLLPDHLHLLMTLPPGDADYSTRVAAIKVGFTRAQLAAGGAEQPRSHSRVRKRRRGIWQRWFWEHTIRDMTDFNTHLDYIHYNPVKHGLAHCPHEWPFSSFARHVSAGKYGADWLCACAGGPVRPLTFARLAIGEIEPRDVMHSEEQL
jgi:putative transposase